jgi:undecaprenyl-diphosphatase
MVPGVSVAALGMGLVGLSVLLGLKVRGPVNPVDETGHSFAVQHRGPGIRAVASVVTVGGSSFVVIPIALAAGLLIILTLRRRGTIAALAVVLLPETAGSARYLLSVALGRARPPTADWISVADGYAYPSGHTSSATVAAGVIVWTTHLLSRDRRVRLISWVVAASFAVLVGWSRIWLGVHWPLDVLGGVLFGAGGVLIVVAGVRCLSDRRGANGTEPVVTEG